MLPALTPQHQPKIIPPGKRVWHFDSKGLDFTLKPGSSFKLVPANSTDWQKVQGYYLRSPVSGYELASVEIVYNPDLTTAFESRVSLLAGRALNSAFAPRWPHGQDAQARRSVYDLYKVLAHPESLYPGVKLLPMWHGTKNSVLGSLCQTGFANLALTDSGYFGKGIYTTFEAEYAHRVYSKGEALILTWVACYSAYPVIDGDMGKLKGKANFENYDAHFIPVVPQNPQNPHEVSYLPCKPQQKHRYIELVVFEQAQCFPRFIVRLQANLKKQVQSGAPAKVVDAIHKLYHEGKVYYAAKNYSQALKCFTDAAAKGHPSASYRAGMCYYNGEGTPVDYSTALKHFQNATNQQNPLGTYMLGLCCYYGNGCVKDMAKAKQLFSLSASKGCQEAVITLKTFFK